MAQLDKLDHAVAQRVAIRTLAPQRVAQQRVDLGVFARDGRAQLGVCLLLRQRIAEQKYVLSDLISLMESYNKPDALSGIMSELSDLNASFEKVDIQKGKTETSEDEAGTMVIGGSRQVNISDEVLAEISDKITQLRTKSIQ